MKNKVRTKQLSLKAWKVRATVEFIIEREHYFEGDEDEDAEEGVCEDIDLSSKVLVKKALKGHLVKIKSGLLENRFYGEIVKVESIEPTVSESEITISDSVTD